MKGDDAESGGRRAAGRKLARVAAQPDQLQLEAVTIADARPEWDALAPATSNPFLSVEWCEAWLEHGGVACTPRVFAARRADGSVAAVLPLAVVPGRYVRKLRFLGFGAANELGPVCAATDRVQAVAALRRALEATRRQWDVFLGESLAGPGWADALGATLVSREGNPVIRGTWQDWDEYLASRSKSFRVELRRQERKLAKRGLEFRTVASRDELDPALDRLFELHRARWSEQASPWFAGREALHRAFAAAAFDRGWLRLHLLELEGRVAAVYLGLRFGRTAWYYQLGRETEDRAASLGVVLVAHAVREAQAEGIEEFNLGPGTQRYKERLATEDPGVETVGIGRRLRGRAAILAARRRAG
jgi:CelD/BcsL family acetyltransferase involved in cellulose biosynthesis